jgi:hypothetical protein
MYGKEAVAEKRDSERILAVELVATVANQDVGSTSTIYACFRVEYLPTSWPTILLTELNCCKAR